MVELSSEVVGVEHWWLTKQQVPAADGDTAALRHLDLEYSMKVIEEFELLLGNDGQKLQDLDILETSKSLISSDIVQ